VAGAAEVRRGSSGRRRGGGGRGEGAPAGVKVRGARGVEGERGWGKMRSGVSDPCWISAWCEARGDFSGRGQPCPGAKLDFSFSTGQG
jgi:hypothetical protein